MGTPDWNGFLASIWGDGIDCSGPGAIVAQASNVVVGSNPAYSIQDFLALFPKWGGPTLSPVPTCSTTQDSDEITVSANNGIAVGNPVAAAGIPDGAFVTAINGTTVTLSEEATATAADVALTVWNAPLVPFAILQAYLALASASLMQARWQEQWIVAMGLFVSHFLTLYARTDGNPNATVSQAAAQGLAFGVQISKSVGDLSVGYQAIQGIESWGAWNLTTYGQELATMAKIIGAGPQFLW